MARKHTLECPAYSAENSSCSNKQFEVQHLRLAPSLLPTRMQAQQNIGEREKAPWPVSLQEAKKAELLEERHLHSK
jgi:hypothetical protein